MQLFGFDDIATILAMNDGGSRTGFSYVLPECYLDSIETGLATAKSYSFKVVFGSRGANQQTLATFGIYEGEDLKIDMEAAARPINKATAWNDTKKATVKLKDAKVEYDAYDFNYIGEYEEWIAPETGLYRLETWGAQGNDPKKNRSYGGKGAYAAGSIYLEQGDTLYIYVGEHRSDRAASWNSGSTGGSTVEAGNGGGANGYGGGGATDIRLKPNATNTVWNDVTSLRSRIMVAGGGGGATDYSYPANGGYGGELIGGTGINGKNPSYSTNIPPTGGTQNTGGVTSSGSAAYFGTAGTFGVGGNGHSSFGSGGGGGYYGGGGRWIFS